jgi:hypothetical protein
LWLLCALILLGSVPVEARGDGSPAALALVPVLMLVWSYLLLRGLRWLWFLTLATSLVIIPGIVLGTVTWEGYVESVLGAALLLMPDTRQYVFARRIQEGA